MQNLPHNDHCEMSGSSRLDRLRETNFKCKFVDGFIKISAAVLQLLFSLYTKLML